MRTVHQLHILFGDFILHKRTIAPIKAVVYALRRWDVDHATALVDARSSPDGKKVDGFMTQRAKIYLADVHDHIAYVLASLDMFADVSKNLIAYTFNTVSHDMNQVMRQLTVATVLFLPLILLTAYFGMNFEPMWSVNNNSDVLFWIIAIPCMSIIVPAILFKDIVRMLHYLRKRMTVQQALREMKMS